MPMQMDVLCHLPLPKSLANMPIPQETILLMESLKLSPVTATQIKDCMVNLRSNIVISIFVYPCMKNNCVMHEYLAEFELI